MARYARSIPARRAGGPFSPLGTAGAVARTRLAMALGRPGRLAALAWEPTRRCPARCRWCSAWREEPGREFRPGEVFDIFSDPRLGRLDLLRVTGGEPFHREDAPELLLDAARAARPRLLYITTNGYYPERTEEALGRLSPLTPLHLQVSLDAVGPAHDRLRGLAGLFEAAAETLDRAASLAKRRPLTIGVNLTVGRANLAEAPAVIRWCRARSIPCRPALALSVHEGGGTGGSGEAGALPKGGNPPAEPFDRREALRAAELLREGILREKGGGAFFRELYHRRLTREAVGRLLGEKREKNPSLPCAALFAHARLAPDGTLYSCVARRLSPGRLGAGETLSELWRSGAAREALRAVLSCPGCRVECDVAPSLFYTGRVLRELRPSDLPALVGSFR